ncbi:MAG: flagellar filament capping protein FliD [Planctomycetaceae bacterium]|nr:flagellar filament capping protein FliD [Planctomycetaceae bacterium]
MSNLTVTTGLVSGLDIAGLVEALSLNQQQAIKRLDARADEFEIKKTSLNALEAKLLSLASAVTTLGNDITFEQLSVTNSNESQLKVFIGNSAVEGTYVFQALQKSASQQSLSRGFADADQQTLGTGTLTISQGGFLDDSTLLETLNDGSGIRRGLIRVTDRSGASANIDLTKALTVDDVLNGINNNVDINVTVRAVDGQFIIEDSSGSTATNLSVVDLNGGQAAVDLGIDKSVAATTLTGDIVHEATENFSLGQINDGNNLNLLTDAPDLSITLEDATVLEINFDGSKTIKDIITKINDHVDNGGKLTAALVNGRIELTDTTAGGGTLTVADINNSTVSQVLGLDAAVVGSTLTGNRLSAGMNSVLLRNLRGGQGITQLDTISLTDRSGQTASVDLSSAETLNDVIEAINSAQDTGSDLLLHATLNSQKDGIVITDTSGLTASNLIIADTGTSTLAADLGIVIDAAVDEVNSNSLSMRYVNQATDLSEYAPDGGIVEEGLIQITDSDGNVGVIDINSAAKTIGDVITRINANSSISVTAELNETGDGFVIIDEAGGAGTLSVVEFGETTTAADLRLLGDATTGGDGKQRVSSRRVTLIEIEVTDTLEDLVIKLNEAGGLVNASVFDDGSSFNSTRLSLTSGSSGRAGRMLIDDGGLGLNFTTIVNAQDSMLQVGSNSATAFLITSADNNYDNVVEGIDLDILQLGSSSVTIDIAKKTSSIVTNIESLVSTYNSFLEVGTELTKFDSDTNQRGILQGDGFTTRVNLRLDTALHKRFGSGNETIKSLIDLGIRVGTGGILVLNKERLEDKLKNDLSGVKEFFTAADTGFSAILGATLTSLTDVVDGTFTNEKDVLDSSIKQARERIEELNILLESKKSRLLNEFIKMETIISSIQSQQSALEALQPILNKKK